MTESARGRAMMENGGTIQTEAAVRKGLKWLVDHQNADGSWAPQYTGAMTGFALLCFLGHGETPDSADYGPAVKKGIDWLVSHGKDTDGRLSMTNNFTGMDTVYQHAIATFALGEYYTMTQDESVAGLLKKAVGYIVQGQAPDGGWQYRYLQEPESDTSVSCWQIQALKIAHISGLNIDGVDAALDKAMLNLRRVQAPDGSFGYRKAGDRYYSLDGAGVYCTYFWTTENNKTVRDGMGHLLKMTGKECPPEYKHERADLYAWYYDTLACFTFGGEAWAQWNRRLQEQLVKNQTPDGSWPPTAGKSPGGEIQRDPEGAGPFYRTSLCILMLEIYYRGDPIRK